MQQILSYPLSHSRFIIFMFTFIVAIIQAGAAEADTTQQLQHQCYYYDCLRTSWQLLVKKRSGLKARKKKRKNEKVAREREYKKKEKEHERMSRSAVVNWCVLASTECYPFLCISLLLNSFTRLGSSRSSSNNNRQIKPGESLLASYNEFSVAETAAPKER